MGICLSKLTFYRGIAVPTFKVNATIKKIYDNGLCVGQGNWVLLAADLRASDLSKLICDPKLDITITRKKCVETFAATGDYETALFYACKHNQTEENTEGIIVEFVANVDKVFVDGRDFLYTIFQWFDKKDTSQQQKVKIKKVLKKIFGPYIIRYITEVFKTPRENQGRRIALTDIAINDRKIVLAYMKNKIWINGRYGTWFRNSFLIEGSIPPEDIVKVQHVECRKIVLQRRVPPFIVPEFYISLQNLI